MLQPLRKLASFVPFQAKVAVLKVRLTETARKNSNLRYATGELQAQC